MLLIPRDVLAGVDTFELPVEWPRDPNCPSADDADFTLFFQSSEGNVESVRFKGKFMPHSNGGSVCP